MWVRVWVWGQDMGMGVRVWRYVMCGAMYIRVGAIRDKSVLGYGMVWQCETGDDNV